MKATKYDIMTNHGTKYVGTVTLPPCLNRGGRLIELINEKIEYLDLKEISIEECEEVKNLWRN